MEPDQLPVTGCVIAFNEEQNLEDCLKSLAFCAALVVVDSHSTDATREIAARFEAVVIERDWPGHIEQKNFAIEQAETDWVLCLDADERVTPDLRHAITQIFAGEGPAEAVAGYTVRRRNRYLGRWMKHSGWYPDRKLRLFRRERGRWGGTNPHDHVFCDGEVRALPYDLLHLSYRDLADHLRTVNSFTTIAAREKLKKRQGMLILRLLFAPPFKAFRMYVLKLGFLDGWPGLIAAIMSAHYVFLKYAKLWELRHVKGEEKALAESSYSGA